MIAADTSSWINFFKDVPNSKASLLRESLDSRTLLMPPPVLMELLSFQGIQEADRELLRLVPRVALKDNYWERSGEARSKLLKKGLRARSIDCLIAQCCMDHALPLITEDEDFRHFKAMGLRLL